MRYMGEFWFWMRNLGVGVGVSLSRRSQEKTALNRASVIWKSFLRANHVNAMGASVLPRGVSQARKTVTGLWHI
jgi:hypothetical protein